MKTQAVSVDTRPTAMLAMFVAITWSMMGVMGESCGDGRNVGDKWFDGCQWCVCKLRGPVCSSSTCSSLVKQVPACHNPGQRWTDGCYRCRCRRQGITCRLDATCRLLRQQPVPCLADKRCVCGPDGVPSCTAEVIDRNAFSARRVHLGFPHNLDGELGFQDSHEGRHEGRRGHSSKDRGVSFSHQPTTSHHWWSDGHSNQEQAYMDRHSGLPSSQVLNDQQDLEEASADQTSQELLITSDNLCRFGARWYGGSLRCFCDVDGAIACGNPVFVLALFDDFRVEREQCEEGHAWEDDCRVCTCRLNGVMFCRHSRNCQQGNFFEEDDDKDETDSFLSHLLEDKTEASEKDPMLSPSTYSPQTKNPTKVTHGSCVPGSRWKKGCLHCRCNHHGRVVCSRRHCKNGVDKNISSHGSDGRDLKPVPSNNHAKNVPATMKPSISQFPRGPMMVAPKPVGIYQPPAYSKWRPYPISRRCGRFKVGEKYWDDCNLCLCTHKGPRCEGKLCR